MAKKTHIKQPTNLTEPVKLCGDCGHGNWVDSFNNLDWEGKPICLTCPFNQWHILRGTKACKEWKPKEGKQ